MKNRIAEFWRRNAIAVAHFPIIVAATLGAYILLRALDPRIGLEGFGDVFGFFVNAVRAIMVVALSWLTKRNAWFDLHRTTELDLFERAREGDRVAEAIVRRDRLEWAFLLCFFAWLLTR